MPMLVLHRRFKRWHAITLYKCNLLVRYFEKRIPVVLTFSCRGKSAISNLDESNFISSNVYILSLTSILYLIFQLVLS